MYALQVLSFRIQMFAVCLLAWTIQQAILGHEVVGGDAAALPWSFFPSTVIVPWESGYTLYSANCYCGSPWTDLTTVWRHVSLLALDLYVGSAPTAQCRRNSASQERNHDGIP